MKFFLEEDINCIFDSLKNKSDKLSGKKILISGGAGFLGTHFVQVINKLNQKQFKKPCKVHIIDRFIDKEKKKELNKYMPGLNIPIVNSKILLKEQPDYVLILAWHLWKPIVQKWKRKKLKSKFIIPLPKFKIV